MLDVQLMRNTSVRTHARLISGHSRLARYQHRSAMLPSTQLLIRQRTAVAGERLATQMVYLRMFKITPRN